MPDQSTIVPRAASRTRRLPAACVLVLIGALAAPLLAQGNDADFKPSVPSPAFAPGQGPRLLIDEGHRNLHTASGRYAAFAAVASADGFEVRASSATFLDSAPPVGSVLVIANARGESKPGDAAFQPAESERLRAWVESGGALFLIADHAPFGSAARSLAGAFGVEMLDGHVEDAGNAAPELPGAAFIEFTRAKGTLADHAITRGRGASESLTRVVTFGGTALRPGPHGIVLLRLGPQARASSDPDDPRAKVETVAGLAQAVAVELGKGRVVIVGEAGLFGAQTIDGEAAKRAGLPGALRFGMNHPGTDDQQFLLNALRWLARAL